MQMEAKNPEINYKPFFATPWCVLRLCLCEHSDIFLPSLCFIQVTHAQSISNSSLSSPSPFFSLSDSPFFLCAGLLPPPLLFPSFW